MTTNTEMMQAAERLRRNEYLEASTDGFMSSYCLQRDADRRAVADFALPLLDQTPIDIEWLEGLSREGGDMSFMAVRLVGDSLHLMAPGRPTEGIEGLRDYVAPKPATRGSVRLLCLALGIELKEQASETRSGM